MTGPKPVLHNGQGQPQGIYETKTSPVVGVGTRASLDDGRVFYYARNSGAALVAGDLVMAELVSVDWDDLATTTAVVGARYLNVTPVGTKAYTAQELANGYASINSGTTGAGITYKIRSNPATSAATAVNLELYDPIAVAFNADTTATISKNPWMDTVVAGAGQAHLCVGVPPIAVGIGSTTPVYYWCQTWGVAAVNAGAVIAAGIALMTDTTTAGQTLTHTAAFQIVGINLFASVHDDWCPLFLQVAP